jgi:hypothetical protein
VTTALEIIVDAYERINRLSPGETLSDDDAAFGLRRLNLLVDELSARPQFLFREVLTGAAQTGDITLGAGDWATIGPGTEIISAKCDNVPMSAVTVQQYLAQYRPTPINRPNLYAHDGFATVYLYPAPAGQTITLQTRVGVRAFADQETEYVLPNGWKSALGAGLAVRVAPVLLGGLPQPLIRAERAAMDAVSTYKPAIINAGSYQRTHASGLATVLYGSN